MIKKILISVAIISLPFFILTSEYTLVFSANQPIAKIEEVRGTVFIKRASLDWEKAKMGDFLKKGDFVKTGKGSKATIAITNLKEIILIKLDKETEISVEALLINALSGGQNSVVKLTNGQINITTKKFDSTTVFRTETPNALVEVNKYGFTVIYEEE